MFGKVEITLYCSTFSYIKSVIDRDGATSRNNNHLERPTIFNAPKHEHCIMSKIKVIGQTVQTGELGQTVKQTDATKRIINPPRGSRGVCRVYTLRYT